MDSIKHLANKFGTPLLLFSEKEFKKAYQSIQKYLPQVKHHYALKPLPIKQCVKIINDCDGYIDIASMGELDLVKSTFPDLLNKCIYTHPIKKESEIKKAIENGVSVMVAENLVELKKIVKYSSNVKILIRLAFPNQESLCNLSEKFGADEYKFKQLVHFANKYQLNIIGCSFHVGSQMKQPTEHVNAIKKCKELYDWALNSYGYKFFVLDIGGGFPAKYAKDDAYLKAFCAPIKKVLDDLFANTEVWSEPGRCIAANSMIAVTQVIGKVYKNDKMWYYLDDGIYGSFSGMIFENMAYDLYPTEYKFTEPIKSVFAGPTCDSVDVIAKDVLFQELNVGDYVFAKRIGAYGWANRTNFNLLGEPTIANFDFDLETIENFIEKSEISIAVN